MIQKILLHCALITSLLWTMGCGDDDIDLENMKVPRLMVESRSVSYGDMGGPVVTLPISQTSIPLRKAPVVSEFDIYNVEMVQVEMGVAIMVQTSETGARQLYRDSVTNMGNRMVLMVNGTAIGAHRLDAPIQDGRFFTFVEVSNEELGDLVLDIKESLPKIQKLKNR